jgi:hypothetical protein
MMLLFFLPLLLLPDPLSSPHSTGDWTQGLTLAR